MINDKKQYYQLPINYNIGDKVKVNPEYHLSFDIPSREITVKVTDIKTLLDDSIGPYVVTYTDHDGELGLVLGDHLINIDDEALEVDYVGAYLKDLEEKKKEAEALELLNKELDE